MADALRTTALAAVESKRVARRSLVEVGASSAAEFEHVYRAYFGALRRYVAYALSDPSEADDVVQAVMASAFAACSRSERPVVSMRAWLYTITRHELLKHFERRPRLTLLEQDEIDRYGEDHASDPVEPGWLSDPWLIAHFERLSKREQQVLTLAFVFDLPAREIGRLLGSSRAAVDVAKSTALSKLRTSLAADGRGRRVAFGASRLAHPAPRSWGSGISVLPRPPRRVAWAAGAPWC